MNEGLIPSRYAKALYEFACEKDASAGVYALMGRLEQSFAGNADLSQTISNPFIDDARKMDLLRIAAGVEKGSREVADTVYADWLKLLQENRRLDMARNIAVAYGDIYRRNNHIYRVHITSAAALGAPERERLEKLIRSHLKDATEEYTYTVDPGLVGGFTIDIENERLDASVKNELKQMRLKLLAH